jgi:hypothetical protein
MAFGKNYVLSWTVRLNELLLYKGRYITHISPPVTD